MMSGMDDLQAVGSVLDLDFPFQNIPCVGCASNCFIKSEAGEVSQEGSLTGREFLIKLVKLLRTSKGGGKSKVTSWDSEGDERVPICSDCKGKLALLFELERKLRELEEALEKGVKEYRKLCEDAEGSFQQDGIYDKDERYYKFRRQIVKIGGAIRLAGPRHTDPPRRSLRNSNSSSNFLPLVAISTEERAMVDRYQMMKTEAEVPSSNKLVSDNDNDSGGFQLDSPTPVKFDADEDFLNFDEAPKQNNSPGNKRKRQRKLKSSPQSGSSKSKSKRLQRAASTSGSRLNKKLSKIKTEMIHEDDDSDEDQKKTRDKTKCKEEDDDKDFQLDGDMESEASDSEGNSDSESEMNKPRKPKRMWKTHFDPATGLYSVLNIKFQPVNEGRKVNGKFKFECLECHGKLVKQSMISHVNRFHSSRIKCRKFGCFKYFGSYAELQNHLRTDHKRKSKPGVGALRECPICGKPCFGAIHKMLRHKYTHYSEQDKADAVARGENIHQYSDTYKFQCDHCGKKYSKRQGLECHILRKHSTPEDAPKVQSVKELCTECGVLLCKRYLVTHMLRVHNIGVKGEELKVPTRRFICSYCDKEFSDQKQVARHRRIIHEKDLPFKCTLCPKAFYDKNRLKRHIDSSHNNIRPFVCSHCPLTFFQNNHLTRHIGIYHAAGAVPKRQPFIRGISSGKTKMPGWWRKSGPISDPLDTSSASGDVATFLSDTGGSASNQ